MAPEGHFYHYVAAFHQEAVIGTQLNIKSEDAYRLASRLSKLTGESLTAMVTRALRSELDREERLRDKVVLKARLLAIAAEISANVQPGTTSNHDWLYDEETGLPR